MEAECGLPNECRRSSHSRDQHKSCNRSKRVWSYLPPLVAPMLLMLLFGCGKHGVRAEGPAPEVQVAAVVQQDVPIYTECISTLDGYVNAQIQPQVTGYLMKQNYREGVTVTRGCFVRDRSASV